MPSTRIITGLIILITSSVISGCVAQAAADKATLSNVTQQTQHWTVELSISGGFAGWMKNVSTDSAGVLIINDLKRNKSIRTNLNNKELAAFSALVKQHLNIKTEPESVESSTRCRDCFSYELSIVSHKRTMFIQLNDINLNKSRFHKIVLFLRKIIAKYEPT